MRRFIFVVVGVEVLDKSGDRVSIRLYQINRLQLRNGLTIFHNILHNLNIQKFKYLFKRDSWPMFTCHALAHDIVHLAAWWDDSHAQIVHDKHFPIALFLDCVGSQYISHYFCNKLRNCKNYHCQSQNNERLLCPTTNCKPVDPISNFFVFYSKSK